MRTSDLRTTTWAQPLRHTSTPYVATLLFTYIIAGYVNYVADRLGAEQFLIRSQAPGIYIPFVGTVAVIVLWVVYQGKPVTSRLLIAFLALLMIAWLVQLIIIRVHGDLTVHTIWLFVPTILLLLLKGPSWQSISSALLVGAWLIAAILVVTRGLELLGLVPIFEIPDKNAVQWENERYWQPLREVLLLEGRWPGPFGFNSRTGFMSAIVLVIGLAVRRRSSWLLVLIGAIGIMATAGRMPYLTAAAGVFTVFFFGNNRLVRRLPFGLRLTSVAAAISFVGLYFLNSGTGSTGRLGDSGIWSGYLELWRGSPWIGVGQVGIWEAPARINYSIDAHSIYIQNLTLSGIAGFTGVFGALALGIFIAIRAASRGQALPLALIIMYLVGGATDVLHSSWTSHSPYTIFVILAVVGAGQVQRPQSTTASPAVRPTTKV